jgi:hypothetical protein
MTIQITPELGVPIAPDVAYIDLRARAEAACASLDLLEENGLEVKEPTQEDKSIAAALTASYAADPEKTSKEVTTPRLSSMTPESLRATRAILDEFGRAVVNHSLEIRHTVTNKLILETDNPDPRVRIRALELLGKISDVGLFTDRTEVVVTHQSTDELRNKLREKLLKLKNPIEDYTDVVEIGGETVDLNEELGFSDPSVYEVTEEDVELAEDQEEDDKKDE